MTERTDRAAAGSPSRSSGAARRLRAGWPTALVLVWLALAIADGAFILPSGAASAPATARSFAQASASARRAGAGPRGRRSVGAPGLQDLPLPTSRLRPAAASAIGPGGPGSGDNPGFASMAIDSSTATAWQTDWYRSAAFGNVQPGTGLLIDMGRAVKITSVRIWLGPERGADLRVLAERVPGIAYGRNQATARDAGGVTTLRPARPRWARYLLIWFSLLPPDAAGTFQASIYNIVIRGIASPRARLKLCRPRGRPFPVLKAPC